VDPGDRAAVPALEPWWLGLAMVAYALVANIPCIAVPRYNRL
jgi:hypothetical protein